VNLPEYRENELDGQKQRKKAQPKQFSAAASDLTAMCSDRQGRAVLLLSFALVTLAGNDAVGEAFTVWAYRHSAMVLGTLVLLIYFAVSVIDQLRQEQFSVRRSRFSSALLRAALRPGHIHSDQ
jgi:hypothetical protein